MSIPMGDLTPPLIAPGTEFPVRFAWVDDDITLVYRSIAPAEMAMLKAVYGEDEYPIRLLLATLVSWDLTSGDDLSHPITRETLAQLPLSFLSALLVVMSGDFNKRLIEANKRGGSHA